MKLDMTIRYGRYGNGTAGPLTFIENRMNIYIPQGNDCSWPDDYLSGHRDKGDTFTKQTLVLERLATLVEELCDYYNERGDFPQIPREQP